jgi:hypothetical protein
VYSLIILFVYYLLFYLLAYCFCCILFSYTLHAIWRVFGECSTNGSENMTAVFEGRIELGTMKVLVG